MRVFTFYLTVLLKISEGQRGQKVGGKEITNEDFRSDKDALQYKSETIQDRYDEYAKMGNLQLDDLDENTRFIFYRDDPFQRFMKRLFTWLDILTFVMNLNFQQDTFVICTMKNFQTDVMSSLWDWLESAPHRFDWLRAVSSKPQF